MTNKLKNRAMKLFGTGYKSIWMAAGLAVAMISLPARADATLVLNLDGYNGAPVGGVTCVDNAGCDTNGVTGVINYSNSTLGFWTINIQVASSNGPGTATAADLQIVSLLDASAADTLNITLSDFFSSPTGAGTMVFSSAFTGDQAIQGTYDGHGEKTNSAVNFFLIASSPCTYVFNSPPNQCGPIVDAHGAIPGGYTMAIYQSIVVLGPTAGSTFGVSTHLVNQAAPVPEPATLALFGLGLTGAAALARRRRQRQQAGSGS